MELITVHLHANQRQDTNVLKIIHVLVLINVEMVYWMQEKIVIQSLIALHAKHKLDIHAPITLVLIVEIASSKLANNATMATSQAVHLAKLSFLINAKVYCQLLQSASFVETPFMS